MKRLTCVLLLVFGLIFAQNHQLTPAAAADNAPLAKATPFSRDQIERFLAVADIGKIETLSSGTTKSYRVSMSDGKITHDVHIQPVDEFRAVWKGVDGTIEKNFRDTFKFNVAAYRIDKLLGLNMVPPTVERDFQGRAASFTWWADDIAMTEEDRRAKKVKPPATDKWINQLNSVKVFDQLIYNMDRNQGNLLITSDWRIWLIDHTRAFRTHHTLLNEKALTRCDQGLLASLRKLDRASVTREAGPWLRTEEINALLARRDRILRYFDSEIRNKGEDAVLTGLPRRTPQVSLP